MQRGDKLERYDILSQVGRGSMGVVYAAYDPRLDRRVALKVLRSEAAGALQAEPPSQPAAPALGTPTRHQRMLREAKAMARLSHPNVVAVHEVGTVGGQVFVAMDFIDGITLAEWIATTRPRWREALAAFVQAARGLAAVHDAGLVHRDFKPENVLVARDGTVRVTDFGLARVIEDDSGESADERAGESIGEAPPGAGLAPALTETGAVLGTPAYMAPEQHRGHRADARSDQFAFCVALYEAVHGEHPFLGDVAAASSAGGGLHALALAVVAGRVRPPPRQSDVPVWLRRAILRGLEVDPARRHPSMHALQAALQRDPGAIRRRVTTLAAVVVLLATVAAWELLRKDAPPPELCQGAAERIGEVWSGDSRQRMRAAFAGTGLPYQGASFTEVAGSLDRYTGSWARTHTDTCRATHVRGEQSPALLDLRMGCLERRRGELAALLELLVRADARTVERSVSMISRLSPISECNNVAALTGRLAPAPAQLSEVERLEAQLAQLKALFAAASYRDGLARATEVAAAARQLGYAPLTAEVLLFLGKHARMSDQFELGEQSMIEAIRLAGAGHDDPVLVDVLLELAALRADGRSSYADARMLTVAAEAAVERLGPDDVRRGNVHFSRGEILYYQGKWGESRREYEVARELYTRAPGERSLKMVSVLSGLGFVMRKQGEVGGAISLYRRALELVIGLQGEAHINTAAILNNLGAATMESGDYPGALEVYRRALAIKEKVQGPDHTAVSVTLHNIGNVLFQEGRYQEAEVVFARAMAIREKTMPESLWMANSLVVMGDVRRQQGRADEAQALYARALAMKEKLFGAVHPEIIEALAGLGDVMLDRGRLVEAQAYKQRALDLLRQPENDDPYTTAQGLGDLAEVLMARGKPAEAAALLAEAQGMISRHLTPDHPTIIPLLALAGECALRTGQLAEARAQGERGLALALAASAAPRELLGKLRFLVAQVRWGAGERDRGADGAVALARAAYEDLGAAGPRLAALRAQVARWLAAHAPRR